MSRLPLTLGVAAGVVLLDQVTKIIAVARLEGEPPIQVIGEWLQLTFVRNSGAAFSLAGNYTIVISVLAIVVAVAIVRTARTLTNVWWAVVLGGILGGALGNLIDRIFREPAPFRGHVVDFLELPNWPVFNVADMALVGSAILAVILSVKGVEMGAPEPVEEQADASDPEPGEADLGETRTDG
ncbi:MAG: signal peptidase II [Actinomycetota bacterium]|nr:signal peptidase II [Actinomycetota bacterium]MDH4015844.1 signal peptidase II [Actinomycetota bacterium]